MTVSALVYHQADMAEYEYVEYTKAKGALFKLPSSATQLRLDGGTARGQRVPDATDMALEWLKFNGACYWNSPTHLAHAGTIRVALPF